MNSQGKWKNWKKNQFLKLEKLDTQELQATLLSQYKESNPSETKVALREEQK